MCRYRVTGAGRLIDSVGDDLEPDGYRFYTVDRDDGDGKAHGDIPGLREYRARFLSGQLQNIVRVNEDDADRVRYGLALFAGSSRARLCSAIRMKRRPRISQTLGLENRLLDRGIYYENLSGTAVK
jgi:hypothetical protein